MQKYLAFSKFGGKNAGKNTAGPNRDQSGSGTPADPDNESGSEERDYYTRILYKEAKCIHSIRHTNNTSFEEQLMLSK